MGAHGMQVVARRFRTRLGEIDLVAWDGAELVFCEVKARRSARHGTPEEAVSTVKQMKVRRLAEEFLQLNQLTDAHVRFDVIGVRADGRPGFAITHIPHAF